MFCNGFFNGFGGFNGMQSAWPWMVGAGIFKILIIGLITFFIVKLLVNSRRNNGYAMNSQAMEILQHRYAKGEISEEEYMEKVKILKE